MENLELDADFWVACVYCFENNQNVDQYLKVGIELESVRIAALNTGDCFDLVNKDEEIGWNTYVQYRACDLLHDGEVYYRENQLDFGDNQVSYTNLLNLFTQTCNSVNPYELP